MQNDTQIPSPHNRSDWLNKLIIKARNLTERPIFPFLINTYAVIALYAMNVDQLAINDIFRSLLISNVVVMILLLVTYVVFRNWYKSAVFVALLVVIFLSYGHLYSIVKSASILGATVGRHRYLILLSLVIILCTGFFIYRKHKSTRAIRILNFTSMFLILISSITIGSQAKDITYRRPVNERIISNNLTSVDNVESQVLPDIYYIIPDSYPRTDILQTQYDYANTEFTEYLNDRGFFVAEESRSNYGWTFLSLSSSLNMDYVQTLVPGKDPGRNLDYNEAIKHSLVRSGLEELGYITVTFPTGWVHTEIFDADVILTPNMTQLDQLQVKGAMNEFEGLLLYSSAFRALFDFDLANKTQVVSYIQNRLQKRWDIQKDMILGTFDNLKRVPHIPGPKFVFAHIISPHPPFLFDQDGNDVEQPGTSFTLSESEDVTNERYIEMYRDQLIFINKELMETIDVILEESNRPVVILIQSDHGHAINLDWEDFNLSDIEAQMSIINAYLVPNECNEMLYASISPVNSFRMIFNCLYDGDYPLLIDRSYIGYHNFTDIEDVINGLNLAVESKP
jgi:hypothetical protein